MTWTGNKIGELMAELGLNVKDFANLVGVSQATIYRWLAAKEQPLRISECVRRAMVGLKRPGFQRVAANRALKF